MRAPHTIRFFNCQETNRVSHVSYQTRIFSYIYTKPRAKRASRCQDIHRNKCAPPAAEETQIQNRPLRPARRSEFGAGRRWRVSRRSGNTNPREERVRISRDIRDLRGRSSWSIDEGLIGNRLLRLARRSNLGLGRRSSVFRRSWNTNPREERVRISRDIRDLIFFGSCKMSSAASCD